MPLNTQILRDGEHVPYSGNYWLVAGMTLVASIDSGKGPWTTNSWETVGFKEAPKEWHDPKTCDNLKQKADDITVCEGCGKAFPIVVDVGTQNIIGYPHIGATPLNDGDYTVKNGPYVLLDQRDGEIFTILPGDVLVAYRTMK